VYFRQAVPKGLDFVRQDDMNETVKSIERHPVRESGFFVRKLYADGAATRKGRKVSQSA
jgi:hypothetical protein